MPQNLLSHQQYMADRGKVSSHADASESETNDAYMKRQLKALSQTSQKDAEYRMEVDRPSLRKTDTRKKVARKR